MARTTHSDPVPTPAGGSARRRRPLLFTLTALGAATGLLGLAGVFATGSDRATTGQNDAITGDLPSSPTADLQLATATFDPDTGAFACGTDWSDDLTSGIVTSSAQTTPDLHQGGGYSGAVCVRNNGNVPLDVSASSFNVVDTELGCSPDEAESGDTTCGTGVGELSSALHAGFTWAMDGTANNNFFDNCRGRVGVDRTIGQMDDGASPMPLGTLAPDSVLAFCTGVSLSDESPMVQSDQVTWQYAFDGVDWSGVDCDGTDANEPNDSFYQATPMHLDDAFDGVSCGGDYDWFNLQSGPATVRLDWTGSAHLSLVGFDDMGRESSRSTEVSGNHDEVVATTGITHFEVVSDSPDATPYTITYLTPVR